VARANSCSKPPTRSSTPVNSLRQAAGSSPSTSSRMAKPSSLERATSRWSQAPSQARPVPPLLKFAPRSSSRPPCSPPLSLARSRTTSPRNESWPTEERLALLCLLRFCLRTRRSVAPGNLGRARFGPDFSPARRRAGQSRSRCNLRSLQPSRACLRRTESPPPGERVRFRVALALTAPTSDWQRRSAG